MRGYFHLDTLKNSIRETLVRKLFWSFISFSIFTMFIQVFVSGLVISHEYPKDNLSRYIYLIAFSIFFFMSVVSPFMYIMMVVVCKPFEDFFGWVKESNFKNHIEVPDNTPRDLIPLYGIVNLAVDDLEHAHQVMIESEKNKAVSTTIQTIEHEVRKPLDAMQSLFHFLTSKRSLDEKISILEKYIPRIELSLEDAESLMNNVSGFASDIQLETTCVPLNEVIKLTLESFFISGKEKFIIFEYDQVEKFDIHVDLHKMRLVFKNLISNAYEEMENGGKIKFSAKKTSGDFIQVCILNSGSFIDEENIKRIFDLHFTTKKQGRGIGLVLTRKIVRDHGGEISCISRREEGTAFFIKIPGKERVSYNKNQMHSNNKKLTLSSVKNEGEVNALPLFKRALLVVDDDTLYLDYLTKMFTEICPDLNVITATNHNSAKHIIDKMEIFAALVDYDLGDTRINGISIIKYLNAENSSKVTSWLHTSLRNKDVHEQAIKAGANSVCLKPIREKDINRLLNTK